jgi:hypothetical protein
LTHRIRQAVKAAIALPVMLPVALALGVATGLAGRVLNILGFYEVLAALTLSVAAVALAHLLRWQPRGGALVVALLAAATWLTVHRVTDAWGFRAEQAQIVLRESHDLAEDFLVSGADTPLQLVDLGLQAETGADGIRGALLVEWQAGPVVLRALGLERRLPPEPIVQALMFAATLAFMALLIRRALLHLAAEPLCATCGRYLRRERLGRVSAEEAQRLVAAWATGDAAQPELDKAAAGPEVLRETCGAGHTARPGLALVQFRSRTLGSGAAGLVARLPAEVSRL